MPREPHSADRWQRIDALLDQLFELDAAAREQELQRLSAEDPSLAREVRALLAADRDRSGEFDLFLEGGAAPLAEQVGIVDEETVENVLPSSGRIGPYDLERVLGSGGMSVVYLGRRVDGEYRDEVAVKLLRHPGRHPDQVRRFRVERQILAHLRHPNIARILDGGVTDDGWPYLVMEYVQGDPINEYCARTAATLTQRLALFEDVCRAVHHAHQHLVVHRDLKPSNILVTTDGRVKLLDFGIAKLLEDEGGIFEQTVPLTEAGLRMFTPDYAAPEQVRGETITTATDVYALGVLLYELLSGERPYRLQGRRSSEIERVVCEEDPVRPSTSAARTGASTSSTGANLLVDEGARRRRAQLRGDLDTICLKALRKEPEHRYVSAQDLGADLRRYREGLPVMARPATAGYRFGKFVRRNRLSVVAATLVISLSLTFAFVATLQRGETARARDAAELEARKANEVTSFLLGLFAASNPREDRGDTLVVRDLLERGVARAGQMDEQPLVQAEMLAVMARAFAELGRFDRSEALLRESLTLQEREGGSEEPGYLATLASLGSAVFGLGRYDEARGVQQQVLDSRMRTLGPIDRGTAVAMGELGITYLVLGQHAQAESMLVSALAVLETLGEFSSESMITASSSLAQVHATRGELEAAIAMEESVLARRKRLLGPEHLDVAESLHNLAAYARRAGRLAEAEALYRSSLAIKQVQLPEPHPDLAVGLDNLAIAVGMQGRYDEAEPLFLEALDMRVASFGEAHPTVASSYANLATLMGRKGDREKAVEYAQRSVDLSRSTYPGPHHLMASSLGNLAVSLGAVNRHDEAVASARESLEQYLALFGERSADVARARGNLAAVLLPQGHAIEAERLRRQALEVQIEVIGEEHPETAVTWNGLGEALAAQGQVAAADSAFARALALRERVLGPQHPRTLETQRSLEELRDR